jgi:hypothetical protein
MGLDSALAECCRADFGFWVSGIMYFFRVQSHASEWTVSRASGDGLSTRQRLSGCSNIHVQVSPLILNSPTMGEVRVAICRYLTVRGQPDLEVLFWRIVRIERV